ncbi:hypothetical protein NI389_19820 (plasmid) [Pseudoalteromonas xiamenensis]|uniref:hypothetical protein n=1 Tax=Pseudoalteromonas xiamenensis TaxID=882626 RepID=UPI0027E3DE94|nr:hypothetical protein [Pseudoalteromonas xiamenensis]WMN62049.1 hypothetical protein NI389_19820 [Pseudoalteromonas xiamenensis]
MNEGIIGLCVLLGIGIIVSTVAHAFIRKFPVATIASSIVGSVIFQFSSYSSLNYLDPYFIFAAIVNFTLMTLISLSVGVPFLYRRKNRDDNRLIAD